MHISNSLDHLSQWNAKPVLLQDGSNGMTLPAHLKAAVKNTPGPAGKTELSWLMRTTYISNDSTERRQQGITEKRAKAMRQAQEEAPPDTRETQLEAIEVCKTHHCMFKLL